MEQYNEVLLDVMPGVDGQLGIITLNRPSALNSLNQSMVQAMYTALHKWKDDINIKAVIIRAVPGRAFCAGGDLRSTYEQLHHHAEVIAFFRNEYELNSLIYHYPKPYIALLDGITMGGGVGISIHGSHRVATEKLLFAMPETGIGLFPDVGGTYFLPRVPHRLGFYLGLTGARLQVDDAVALNILDAKVPSVMLPELIEQLAAQSFAHDAKQSVTQIIEPFKTAINPSTLLDDRQALSDCFYRATVEDILENLYASNATICKEAYKALGTKSPTSLKVTLRALQAGEHLSFDACMRQELQLVTHFLQSHDFPEGIRALIIDKDQQPKWVPSTLQEVQHSDVERYFSP